MSVSVSALLWAGAATAQTATNLSSGGLSWTSLSHQSTLLGDMGGLRPLLGRYGWSVGLTETSEVLGNVSGGIRQGAEYDGVTTLTLDMDTKKAFGWDGGTFNASALQLHGRNLSADNLGDLQTASGIEGNRATRLWELWYDQATPDRMFDVKIGQQSIDQEFMASQGSALFVNTMMGWPSVPSYDMPSGGPAFPLSGLGVRLRAQPTPALTLLGGVFNGDPVGTGNDDHGTAFRTRDGVLSIVEAQYAINQPGLGDMVTTGLRGGGGLPGTYRLGAWYDSEHFADQEIDNTGLSLANDATSGTAESHSGDYSIYGVIDQMLWRPDSQSTQSVNFFLRAMGAPGDQNLISFSVNGGLTLKAPFDGRDSDTAGIGFGYVKVSGRAADFDRDTASFPASFPTPNTVRGGETFVEATYQYQFTPWWQFQPDVQYVFNPGAGQNPNNTSQRLGNEAILGIRTNLTF